jgi:hypothetical protein
MYENKHRVFAGVMRVSRHGIEQTLNLVSAANRITMFKSIR